MHRGPFASLVLFAALLVPASAAGQVLWDVIPTTVRGVSMGGAVVLAGRAPSLSITNPAASGSASGVDAGWRRTQRDGTYAWSSLEGRGVTLSLRHHAGPAAPTDLGFVVATSRELYGFDVGVNLTYLERSGRRNGGEVIQLGIGVLRRFGPVDLGASVLGLTPKSVDEIPNDPTWLLNASTRSAEVGPFDVLFAGRLQGVDGDLQGGSGVEVAYWPVTGRTFRILAGHGNNPFTGEAAFSWGASVTLDGLTLEWGAIDSGRAVQHAFGLRWQ